jgi:hypothetical protein
VTDAQHDPAPGARQNEHLAGPSLAEWAWADVQARHREVDGPVE